MDKPRDGDGNDVWILWRLGQVEEAVKQLSDLAVLREQISVLKTRMDTLDTRAQNVSRAIWGLTAMILAALIVFVLTGSQ